MHGVITLHTGWDLEFQGSIFIFGENNNVLRNHPTKWRQIHKRPHKRGSDRDRDR